MRLYMGTRREFYNVVLCLISYVSMKLSEMKSDSIKPKFITRKMKLIMTRHHLVLCVNCSNKKDEYSENTGRAQLCHEQLAHDKKFITQ